jgi:RHS repeat-associated protein
VGNRKWTKRDLANGDVFGYDQNDQVIAVKLNVPNPDNTPAGAQTIIYDANGNRSWFTPYYPAEQYFMNDLSQYTSRTIYYTGGEQTYNATYETKGNLALTPEDVSSRSAYTYDAQNRLTQATKPGVTATFKYDGLNRQVSRTVGGVTTYSGWDGWDLMQEYQGNQGSTITGTYVHGASGLVKEMRSNNYYYQDGSGSTSHLASSNGALVEWYRYDLHGTPIFYNAANTQIPSSNYSVRHLFTGQQWYSDLGLYDLRNRFYSPDIGRFLQPDPIGFGGDPTNLYRYVRNNPVNWRDPSGLDITLKIEKGGIGGLPPGDWNPAEFGYPFGGGWNPAPAPEQPSLPSTDYGPGSTTGGSSGGGFGGGGSSGGFGGGGFSGAGGLGMGPGGRDFGSSASDHIGGNGSRGDGGGGGGGGFAAPPRSLGAIIKSDFYGLYGNDFNSALRQLTGSIIDYPLQTFYNSPDVNTDYNEIQLGRMFPGGYTWPSGINSPFQGPFGTVYIAKESLTNSDPRFVYRVYAHELTNILDARIYGTGPLFESHFGIRSNPPFGDYDSGMALELLLFGPRR